MTVVRPVRAPMAPRAETYTPRTSDPSNATWTNAPKVKAGAMEAPASIVGVKKVNPSSTTPSDQIDRRAWGGTTCSG